MHFVVFTFSLKMKSKFFVNKKREGAAEFLVMQFFNKNTLSIVVVHSKLKSFKTFSSTSSTPISQERMPTILSKMFHLGITSREILRHNKGFLGGSK